MATRTMKCEACGEEFDSEISDEEVLEEQKRLFPYANPEDCAVVCDDCFKLIMTQGVVHPN